MTRFMERTPMTRSKNELILGIIRLKVLFESTKIFSRVIAEGSRQVLLDFVYDNLQQAIGYCRQ